MKKQETEQVRETKNREGEREKENSKVNGIRKDSMAEEGGTLEGSTQCG